MESIAGEKLIHKRLRPQANLCVVTFKCIALSASEGLFLPSNCLVMGDRCFLQTQQASFLSSAQILASVRSLSHRLPLTNFRRKPSKHSKLYSFDYLLSVSVHLSICPYICNHTWLSSNHSFAHLCLR